MNPNRPPTARPLTTPICAPHRRVALFGTLLAALATVGPGCDRHTPPPATQPAPDAVAQAASSPRPTYSIDPALRRQYPRICTFVDAFLQTCLAGDYEGYRGFVSRYAEPEPPDRFQAVYDAVRSVRVVGIDPLERGGPEGQPAWRVVTQVTFDPDSTIHLRRRNNRFAILVFQEQGRWRMMPAPSRLQPRSQPASGPTTTAASQPLPDYPWDQDVDD